MDRKFIIRNALRYFIKNNLLFRSAINKILLRLLPTCYTITRAIAFVFIFFPHLSNNNLTPNTKKLFKNKGPWQIINLSRVIDVPQESPQIIGWGKSIQNDCGSHGYNTKTMNQSNTHTLLNTWQRDLAFLTAIYISKKKRFKISSQTSL